MNRRTAARTGEQTASHINANTRARTVSGKHYVKSAAGSKSRPFKSGDKVWIFHLGSPPIIEGRATILHSARKPADFYCVRFDGERAKQWRFAFPGDWQCDPERMLTHLRALWRVTVQPELLAVPFPSADQSD